MGFRAYWLSIEAVIVLAIVFLVEAGPVNGLNMPWNLMAWAAGVIFSIAYAWLLGKRLEAGARREQADRTREAEDIYASLAKGHGRDYVLYLTDTDGPEIMINNPDWEKAEIEEGDDSLETFVNATKTLTNMTEERTLTPGMLLSRWMRLPVVQLGGPERGPGVVACTPRNRAPRLNRLIEHANNIFLVATEPYATDRALAALKSADRLSSTVILVPGRRTLRRAKVDAEQLKGVISRYRTCPDLYGSEVLVLWQEVSEGGTRTLKSPLNKSALRRLDIDGIPWDIIQQVRISESSRESAGPAAH